MKQMGDAKPNKTSNSDTEPYSPEDDKETYPDKNHGHLGKVKDSTVMTSPQSANAVDTGTAKTSQNLGAAVNHQKEKWKINLPRKKSTGSSEHFIENINHQKDKRKANPTGKKSTSSSDPFVGNITGTWFNQRPPKKYSSAIGADGEDRPGDAARGLSLLKKQLSRKGSRGNLNFVKNGDKDKRITVATSTDTGPKEPRKCSANNEEMNDVKYLEPDYKNQNFSPPHLGSDQYDFWWNTLPSEEGQDSEHFQPDDKVGDDDVFTDVEKHADGEKEEAPGITELSGKAGVDTNDDSLQQNRPKGNTPDENVVPSTSYGSDCPPVLERFDVIHRSISDPDNGRNHLSLRKTGEMANPHSEQNTQEAYVYIDVAEPGLFQSSSAFDLPSDCPGKNRDPKGEYDDLSENAELEWTTWIKKLKVPSAKEEGLTQNVPCQFHDIVEQDVVPIEDAECVIDDTGKADCSGETVIYVNEESIPRIIAPGTNNTEHSEISSSGSSTEFNPEDKDGNQRHHRNAPWETGEQKKRTPTAVVAPQPKSSRASHFDVIHTKKTILHRFLGKCEDKRECTFQLPYDRDLLLRKYIRTGRIPSDETAPRKMQANQKGKDKVSSDKLEENISNVAFREEQERMWQILQGKQPGKQPVGKQRDEELNKAQVNW